jgi:hypothetical protein
MVYSYIKSQIEYSIAFNNAKLVLLPNPTLPILFFEYHICLQRRWKPKIENELYTHELIHSKHTLDIYWSRT